MSWMAPCDELGDRREPVGLGNSVGSNADAALTFKAGHGRVVNEPLDRAAWEREFDAVTELRCVKSLARKPIRGKPFTREFHAHRDFPALLPGLISIKVNFAEVPFIDVFGAPWGGRSLV